MHHSNFLRQLGIWGLHTAICAAPSFYLAILAGFNTFSSIAAMLCGIVSMMFLYAGIYSRSRIAGNGDSVFRRAARYGARTRSVMCLLVLPTMRTFFPAAVYFLIPDVLAGLTALNLVGLGRVVNERGGALPKEASFFQVYSTTVLEALMVSGTIFLLFWGGVALRERIKQESQPPTPR